MGLLKIHRWNNCNKTCIGKNHFFITIRIFAIFFQISNKTEDCLLLEIIYWNRPDLTNTYFWYKYMTYSSSLIPLFILLVASHSFFSPSKVAHLHSFLNNLTFHLLHLFEYSCLLGVSGQSQCHQLSKSTGLFPMYIAIIIFSALDCPASGPVFSTWMASC